MKIEYQHELTPDEIRRKTGEFPTDLNRNSKGTIHDAQGYWGNGDNADTLFYSLSAFGYGVCGRITLDDGKVVAEGNFPETSKAIRTRIEEILKNSLDSVFK